MFLIEKRITDATGHYKFDKDYFYLKSSSSLNILDKSDFSLIWKLQTQRSHSLSIAKDKIIVGRFLENDDSLKVFNKTNGQEIEYQFPYHIFSITSVPKPERAFFLAYPDASRSKSIYGLFDLITMQVIWEKEEEGTLYHGFYQFFHDDFIYGTHQQRTVQVGRIDGTKIWELDFGKPKSILGILGILNDIMYVSLPDNRIIALNFHTGEILYEWNAKEEFIKQGIKDKRITPNLGKSLLLKEENKFIGMYFNTFWEISLESKAVLMYDLSEIFKEEGVFCNATEKLGYIDKYLIFYSSYYIRAEAYHKVVAFDWKNKKICWSHQFDFTNGNGFGHPAVVTDGNRIYVRDKENNLTIFKKE